MTEPTLFQSKSTFAAVVDGATVVVHKGDLAEKGSAILKKHSGLFEPAEGYVRFPKTSKTRGGSGIEQATAAPGEKRTKRGTTRRRAPSKPVTSAASKKSSGITSADVPGAPKGDA